MTFQMDEGDVRAIAAAVSQQILPQLLELKTGGSDDPIMGVQELAEYLGMSDKWIYDQTGGNRIPFFKLGSIIKFRRSVIDKWLGTFDTPAVDEPTSMKKLLRR